MTINDYEQIRGHEEVLMKIADERIKLASEYQYERSLYGEARFNLNIELAKNVKRFNEIKKNMGFDTGLIMLIGEDLEKDTPLLQKDYKDYIESLEKFKGYERLIDALKDKSIAIQSIIKNQVEGEVYGKYKNG